MRYLLTLDNLDCNDDEYWGAYDDWEANGMEGPPPRQLDSTYHKEVKADEFEIIRIENEYGKPINALLLKEKGKKKELYMDFKMIRVINEEDST
jgi:hypothetical protein